MAERGPTLSAQARCTMLLVTMKLSASPPVGREHTCLLTRTAIKLARMGKSAAGKQTSKKPAIVRTIAAVDEDSARGRLLGAATRLFCKNGINATGIDAIISEAGTAKTTLYKLFGSKTALVTAVLESEGKQWREWFIGAIEAGGGDAETKLARIFPALKSWFGEERFYGCPFINAVEIGRAHI